MERKMVSVRTVDKISPIKDADRLEVARIGGWNVVVPKNEFSVDEKIAYFEIDSFLPESVPAFESFQERGQKVFLVNEKEVKGHVLKTIKLRGVVSQGLVLSLEALGFTPEQIDALNVGDDITEDVGVVKYDVEKPRSGEIIGGFDSRYAPKTDAERAQNLSEYWEDIKAFEWEATVKVDGTSQTLFFDSEEARLRIFSRNWEISDKTEGMKVAERDGIADFARENPDVVIQFELAGEGVNGNRAKLTGRRAFVFAVWADGVKVPRAQWDERLLRSAAPLLDIKPEGELEDFIESISGLRGHVTKDVLDEGVVFHLTGEHSSDLPVWMDRNANFKVISNKFILKNKL